MNACGQISTLRLVHVRKGRNYLNKCNPSAVTKIKELNVD